MTRIGYFSLTLDGYFNPTLITLEPVGFHDEIIVDYSIHDAILAGINKIIFVIRKDIETDFGERIGNCVEAICAALNVEIAYAFQDLSSIPDGYAVSDGRAKPWGTGQAILAAKDLIRELFAVINADDYYGKEAFCKFHDWLVQDHNDSAIAMAGFVLKNTLSDNGGLTRGVTVFLALCLFGYIIFIMKREIMGWKEGEKRM